MASIRHRIFERFRRAEDGINNVKMIVSHNGKEAYFSTNIFVSDKQVRPGKWEIKDRAVLDKINTIEAELRGKLAELPKRATDVMSARELGEALLSEPEDRPAESPIDFAAFIREYMAGLVSQGKKSTAVTFRVVYNNLVDYFRKESFPIDDITSGMLRDFESYLRKERKQLRQTQTGKSSIRTAPPVSQNGLFSIMRNLRVLFNAARRQYNTERHTAINHYPFEYYKMPMQIQVRKKGDDLTLPKLVKLRDLEFPAGSRAEQARDVFMLSFYLCGMNAKDIYDYTGRGRKRLEYERSKTKGRRKDGALISVSIPDEATPLLERYNGRVLQRRYASVDNFRRALVIGMKDVSEALKLNGITFYHARHTFATLAYNRCGFSKEEIAAALNHVDKARAVTESYIAHDWSTVDKVQSGVLKLLRRHKVS